MDWKDLLCADRVKPKSARGDSRNEFESDVGRVMFCPALRRMHDKTQVFPLSTDDHIHTRLTHSLEVASLGRDIAVSLCGDVRIQKALEWTEGDLLRSLPNIVFATCLCHDIGNPPFGHYGENAIGKYFRKLQEGSAGHLANEKNSTGQQEPCNSFFSQAELNAYEWLDYCNFDGNAQGLRVIANLLGMNSPIGLNLTFATLASFLKYPCTSDEHYNTPQWKKAGVLQSEKRLLNEIRKHTNIGVSRHPLALLMDSADEIAYRTMDIEDGLNRGYYTLRTVIQDLEDKLRGCTDESTLKVIEKYKNCTDARHKSTDLNEWLQERSSLIEFRVAIITILKKTVVSEFESHYDEIMKGIYPPKGLLDSSAKAPLCTALDDICHERIFTSREILSLEFTGETIIHGLLDRFLLEIFSIQNEKNYKQSRLLHLISRHSLYYQELKDYWTTLEKGASMPVQIWDWSTYQRVQCAVDIVSGMTDRFALHFFQQLEGIRIGHEI